ncbi:hypothetical protein INR49_016583, partial [Caranx melampygus]
MPARLLPIELTQSGSSSAFGCPTELNSTSKLPDIKPTPAKCSRPGSGNVHKRPRVLPPISRRTEELDNSLLSILTATGHLVNSQSYECGESPELEATILRRASLVYSWSGLSLPICILLLVAVWMKSSGWLLVLSVFGTCALFVYMTVKVAGAWKEENKALVALEERYMSLRPLSHTPRDEQMHLNIRNCNGIDNVYRWQTEFKCCGLQTYEDWWPVIPDSCLCEGVDDSSECVQYRNSSVYSKLIIVIAPIFPFLLYPVYGILMCLFLFCWEPCCYKLSKWKYRLSGGEEMVPVVFLRKDSCDQTDEDSGKDREVEESKSDEAVAKDTEDGTDVAQEGQDVEDDDNALTMIPVSLMKRLHEELDPPPVQHQVRCPEHPRFSSMALMCTQVALAGHDLRDLDEDMFVFGAALQVVLDLFAPPNVQESLGLTVAPGQLRAHCSEVLMNPWSFIFSEMYSNTCRFFRQPLRVSWTSSSPQISSRVRVSWSDQGIFLL